MRSQTGEKHLKWKYATKDLARRVNCPLPNYLYYPSIYLFVYTPSIGHQSPDTDPQLRREGVAQR